jgi:hypothetical protein
MRDDRAIKLVLVKKLVGHCIGLSTVYGTNRHVRLLVPNVNVLGTAVSQLNSVHSVLSPVVILSIRFLLSFFLPGLS